jgi:O-antigen/teichoic acid export membrane protein
LLSRAVSSVWEWARILRSSRAVRDSSIVGAVQFATQAIRFLSNIILAALLSPVIFGLMAIVTTIRTGIELLSDVGIGQSIVVSDDGAKQEFVETAWALKIIRGIVLTLVGAAAAFPVAWFYGKAELGPLLLVGSLTSLFSGLERPGGTLCERDRKMVRVAIFRIVVALIGFSCVVFFAWMIPSAMGLVIAGVVASAIGVVVSFRILPLPGYRPRISPKYRSKIMSFGKWIFLSSVIYFFASNFDRLYLPAQIPVVIFGIYSIARSLTEAIVQMAVQVNRLVVLPAVARSKHLLHTDRGRLGKLRFLGLGVVDIGLGVAIASSDIIIGLLFDPRYALAATILPILLLGSWFSIHASVTETTLLGAGHSRPMVGGNFLRLLSTAIALPLALTTSGMAIALLIIALADAPRYLWLSWYAKSKNVLFGSQDAMLLLMALLSAVLIRLLLNAVGLADGFISAVQWDGFAYLNAAG